MIICITIGIFILLMFVFLSILRQWKSLKDSEKEIENLESKLRESIEKRGKSEMTAVYKEAKKKNNQSFPTKGLGGS